ncbi:hypothetical protein [Chamaesiphon sp.]|uniref:hypothetical protein n=1 Tax=Chamaesiphon sp. TaxID=2814140 RepID=UPI0035944C5C
MPNKLKVVLLNLLLADRSEILLSLGIRSSGYMRCLIARAAHSKLKLTHIYL